jgi:hypothetical protein
MIRASSDESATYWIPESAQGGFCFTRKVESLDAQPRAALRGSYGGASSLDSI